MTAGGALMNTTEVENFPGFRDGIMGPALMDEMRAQAERFGAELVPDDVVEVDLTGDVKVVKTATDTYQARAVILAMGSGYRKLDLPNEEALFLTRFASHVTLIHRRDEFRASRIMLDRVRANEKITVLTNTAVTQVEGEPKVTGLRLQDTVTGEESKLAVTGVFVAIGHDPRSDLVRGQVELDDEGYVSVQGRTTATSLDGVFACGDLVDHTYRQAITAAGSGCAAALDAERFLADLDHALATAGATA